MKVLVTGGAGYIGSHTVLELQKKNIDVVIYDNLIYGHKESINAPLVVGDIADTEKLETVFSKNKFDAVVHFAAFLSVAESVANPSKYYNNNVGCTMKLLDTMVKFKVSNIVFSSTAAIFGNPVHLPILEDDPKEPTSPYGETKLAVEKMLKWYERAYGLRFISIRYFNAAGASLDGSIGEDHKEETHIIPLAMQTALGKRSEFTIFGSDYPTKDGTCIRDYIHVSDLADAHILALDGLLNGKESNYYNAGVGNGYSNKEVVEMVKKVTKIDFPVKLGKRREGDPNELVASSVKFQKEFGWKPNLSDLETIVETAWKWHKFHPNGFKS